MFCINLSVGAKAPTPRVEAVKESDITGKTAYQPHITV